MPVLVNGGSNATKSWLIIDVVFAIILVALGAILVYWIRRNFRKYRPRKTKVLDIENGCPHVKEDSTTTHTQSKPVVYQIPSVPPAVHISWVKHPRTHMTTTINDFDTFAPIHDHVIHIPTPKDYGAASQMLKRSFSEGANEFSRYPPFPVIPQATPLISDARHHHISKDIHLDVAMLKQPSSVVVPSGKSRLASAIEGRAATEGLRTSTSSVREQISNESLDINLSISTRKESNTHIILGPESRAAVPVRNFGYVAPIHDHLITAKNFYIVPQQLKRSSSEGIHDLSKLPRFSARQHTNVVLSSRLDTMVEGTTTAMDDVVQEHLPSISASASDTAEEHLVQAPDISQVDAVEDEILDHYHYNEQ